MTERGGDLQSLPAALIIVSALSALAGAVDVCGLSLMKGVFVSFMSGNTTNLGVALASGDGSPRAAFTREAAGAGAHA